MFDVCGEFLRDYLERAERGAPIFPVLSGHAGTAPPIHFAGQLLHGFPRDDTSFAANEGGFRRRYGYQDSYLFARRVLQCHGC